MKSKNISLLFFWPEFILLHLLQSLALLVNTPIVSASRHLADPPYCRCAQSSVITVQREAATAVSDFDFSVCQARKDDSTSLPRRFHTGDLRQVFLLDSGCNYSVYPQNEYQIRQDSLLTKASPIK